MTPFSFLLSAAFLFGTVIGSFLNVVILRHEKDERLTGRSYCPCCKKSLTWYEMVPVLSYVLQKGRCRGCDARISPQYPLVELATGLMFVLVMYHVLGVDALHTAYVSLFTAATLALHVAIWSLLIVITVYDLRTKLIPDRFSYTFAALALILLVVTSIASCGTAHCPLPTADLLAGPLLFLPFWALWKVSDGRWIGLGDGKLALGIGWYLGLAGGGSAIMLAFWIGAVVSLALIAYQRVQVAFASSHKAPTLNPTPGSSNTTSQLSPITLKSEIPLGPFLVLGVLLEYVFAVQVFSVLYY
jgi:leader peptidase (prepilin peptidase)/N-methyltransferase